MQGKNIAKWFLVGLFLISAFAVTFVLFQVPVWLPQYSPAIDQTVVQQLGPLLQRIYMVVGVALATGLGAIVVLINSKNSTTEHITRYQATVDRGGNMGENTAGELEDEVDLGDAEDILSTEPEYDEVFKKALSQVCHSLEASQAAAFRVVEEEEYKMIELFASFAYHVPEGERVTFRFGEGVAGQVAKEGTIANIDAVPEGYIQILSGLGHATPSHLLVLPIKEEGQVVGVVEIASFKTFDPKQVQALENYFGKLALKLSNNDNVRLEEAKQ